VYCRRQWARPQHVKCAAAAVMALPFWLGAQVGAGVQVVARVQCVVGKRWVGSEEGGGGVGCGRVQCVCVEVVGCAVCVQRPSASGGHRIARKYQ